MTAHRGKRIVALYGNSNDINAWSNIPYFFLQAGKRVGFFDDGLTVDVNRLNLARLLWNVAAPLRCEFFGGFQYTWLANDTLARLANWEGITEVISHAQHFPPHELMVQKGIAFSHYIDFPLPSMFEDYGYGKSAGARTRQRALHREREQYAAARYVLCMSPWAARQVIERCGVPSQKVRVLIPGANLPENLFDQAVDWPRLEIPDGKKVPLRVAFVGKRALRKGLDRLVDAIRILKSRGLRVIVRVIGPCENLFPDLEEVEHVGFINKLHEPRRLLDELRACHVGALPSYKEAFGIAALEYLRCGLPAIVTRTGGLGDSIPPDCGVVLPADCDGGDIADTIEGWLKNPDVFRELVEAAREKAAYASWDRTIDDLKKIWAEKAPGSRPGGTDAPETWRL